MLDEVGDQSEELHPLAITEELAQESDRKPEHKPMEIGGLNLGGLDEDNWMEDEPVDLDPFALNSDGEHNDEDQVEDLFEAEQPIVDKTEPKPVEITETPAYITPELPKEPEQLNEAPGDEPMQVDEEA